jgi:uncharacterized Zn finger protein (UPF0148 family)
MSEFNDVTCPTCGHTYGYHAWQEMQQQREEMETARHIRDFAKLTREVHKRQQAEMPEPTIDDLLKWVDDVHTHLATLGSHLPSSREREAIRAILEQHRHNEENAKRADLSAIRAFVERVEKRWIVGRESNPPGTLDTFRMIAMNELAAMEKDNAGSND